MKAYSKYDCIFGCEGLHFTRKNNISSSNTTKGSSSFISGFIIVHRRLSPVHLRFYLHSFSIISGSYPFISGFISVYLRSISGSSSFISGFISVHRRLYPVSSPFIFDRLHTSPVHIRLSPVSSSFHLRFHLRTSNRNMKPIFMPSKPRNMSKPIFMKAISVENTSS